MVIKYCLKRVAIQIGKQWRTVNTEFHNVGVTLSWQVRRKLTCTYMQPLILKWHVATVASGLTLASRNWMHPSMHLCGFYCRRFCFCVVLIKEMQVHMTERTQTRYQSDWDLGSMGQNTSNSHTSLFKCVMSSFLTEFHEPERLSQRLMSIFLSEDSIVWRKGQGSRLLLLSIFPESTDSLEVLIGDLPKDPVSFDPLPPHQKAHKVLLLQFQRIQVTLTSAACHLWVHHAY